jgi:hypothetical protein
LTKYDLQKINIDIEKIRLSKCNPFQQFSLYSLIFLRENLSTYIFSLPGVYEFWYELTEDPYSVLIKVPWHVIKTCEKWAYMEIPVMFNFKFINEGC